jgi:hypothetical protein
MLRCARSTMWWFEAAGAEPPPQDPSSTEHRTAHTELGTEREHELRTRNREA